MREALRVHAGTLVGRRVRIVQGSPLVAPSFRFLSGEAGMAMGYEEATGELAISLDNPKFGRLNLHALAARLSAPLSVARCLIWAGLCPWPTHSLFARYEERIKMLLESFATHGQ